MGKRKFNLLGFVKFLSTLRSSPSIRRFWEKRGKMEAKKGESFIFSPLPPPQLKSPLP